MQTKLKKVYYCDFCKKHSLRSLAKHEKHCTGNPDRTCRLCDNNNDIRAIAERLSTCKPTANAIQDAVEGCPNCALTLIKYMGYGKENWIQGFHYRTELQEWWGTINQESYETERNQDYIDMII